MKQQIQKHVSTVKNYAKARPRWLRLTAALLLLAGSYLLLLTVSPQLNVVPSPYNSSPNEVAQQQAQMPDQDYVYVEKINLKVPFASGDKSVLKHGAWHRYPERGDPEIGGNFILSAHRFQMGLTPAGTKRLSPFYTLDKVHVGDTIAVRYSGQDYKYKVTRTYTVKPDAVEIENPSTEAKLTLYTCTLKGSADGRAVVEAQLF